MIINLDYFNDTFMVIFLSFWSMAALDTLNNHMEKGPYTFQKYTYIHKKKKKRIKNKF